MSGRISHEREVFLDDACKSLAIHLDLGRGLCEIPLFLKTLRDAAEVYQCQRFFWNYPFRGVKPAESLSVVMGYLERESDRYHEILMTSIAIDSLQLDIMGIAGCTVCALAFVSLPMTEVLRMSSLEPRAVLAILICMCALVVWASAREIYRSTVKLRRLRVIRKALRLGMSVALMRWIERQDDRRLVDL